MLDCFVNHRGNVVVPAGCAPVTCKACHKVVGFMSVDAAVVVTNEDVCQCPADHDTDSQAEPGSVVDVKA